MLFSELESPNSRLSSEVAPQAIQVTQSKMNLVPPLLHISLSEEHVAQPNRLKTASPPLLLMHL